MDDVLSSDRLKKRIESLSSGISELTLVTAYIKLSAVKWLASLLQDDVKLNIVARLNPQDIISGASDIDAIEIALDKGWSCFRLPELHAKLYLINNKKLFVGSANFTARGLLLYGTGNLEATIEVDASIDHIDFINTILSKSVCISFENLIEIKRQIEKFRSSKQESDLYWDEDVPNLVKMWSADFPWSTVHHLLHNDNHHDRELFGVKLSDDEIQLERKFKRSKAFLWLYSQLTQTENGELFFGRLSSILHDALLDDPSLYRKDVKILLINLLDYCKCHANDVIIIDRPGHSERVRLIDK